MCDSGTNLSPDATVPSTWVEVLRASSSDALKMTRFWARGGRRGASAHAARGVTRKAGTWPPPEVTLARPVALRRGRKPQRLPRKRYGGRATRKLRELTFLLGGV